MPAMIMRFESHKTIRSHLLNHYDGTTRPEHATPPEDCAAVEPMRKRNFTADQAAKTARANAKRHKALGITGRRPNPLVSVLIAGPPAWRSKDAWPKKRVNEWAMETFKWLQARVDAASDRKCIVGAWLHNDERSPHLHVVITPALSDGSLGWGKLQVGMAELCPAKHDSPTGAQTRAAMRELQNCYYRQVAQKFGLERGQVGSTRPHVRPKHDAPSADESLSVAPQASQDESARAAEESARAADSGAWLDEQLSGFGPPPGRGIS